MSEYLAQKHALYAQVGRLSRALGQQTRLEIIEILAQAPRSVETIASLLQTDIRSVSQHLQVLVECGLLTVERKGRFRWYAVRFATGGAASHDGRDTSWGSANGRQG